MIVTCSKLPRDYSTTRSMAFVTDGFESTVYSLYSLIYWQNLSLYLFALFRNSQSNSKSCKFRIAWNNETRSNYTLLVYKCHQSRNAGRRARQAERVPMLSHTWHLTPMMKQHGPKEIRRFITILSWSYIQIDVSQRALQ